MTQQPPRTVTCEGNRLLAASTTWTPLPRWFGSRARSPGGTPAAQRPPARGMIWPACTRPSCRRRGGPPRRCTPARRSTPRRAPGCCSPRTWRSRGPRTRRRGRRRRGRAPLPPFLLQNGHSLSSTLWLTSPYNGFDGGGARDANPNA
jgi:hypothetical protein